MTTLQWDQVGSHRYETGCDRGVLYLPDGSGVVWNGLTSVEDTLGDAAVTSYWLDGVKYLTRRSPGDWSGTMKALTYPDQFEQFDGVVAFDTGMYASNQPVMQPFNLSYRTLIGTDDSPLGSAYRIHLLYNVTALADARSYSSVTNVATPEEFSWKLEAVPVPVPGLRPTAHISIKSSDLTKDALAMLEAYLYGSATANASLPNPHQLADLYNNYTPVPPDIISALINEPL